ncbi:peptide chain release factor N(5)-glutamine methyltransferase [Candidatus Daviesbacteria bacterium]|nr:peptide chain release factor N(5)-glutamine methyltransferase [Candidatus Daviesbacteria bacterium]
MTSSRPSQYSKGWVEFYKLKFKVTPDVLIPRPETELLVDEVLKNIKDEDIILDIGTGAGNIAVSLACNLGGYNVKIIATDVSSKALKIARQNAKLHGVEDKIRFTQSDLLSAFCHSERSEESLTNVRPTYVGDPSLITQDDNLIIVTNLPYIPTARIPYLDSSVKDFEPHIALDGGEDGFKLYRKLFHQVSTLGVTLGWHPRLIIGEIDYTHGKLALNETQKFFPMALIEVKKDLAHLQRILLIHH